jgi:hypothetical protein
MDKQKLFKLIAEHYELEADDFWQHRQSKNWILSHNAVRKISHQQTPEGHTIVPPFGTDLRTFKDGDVTQAGVFGPEVVLGGSFKLVDSNHKIIRQVFAIGEANPRNVNENVSYPWAMAYKRMFDRGVLDVLAFAELNIYSSIEADEFKNSKPSGGGGGAKEAAPKKEVPMPRPAPPRAVEAKPEPPVPAEPSTMLVGRAKDLIKESLSSEDGFISKRDLVVKVQEAHPNPLPYMEKPLNVGLSELVEAGVVKATGQGRGMKYGIAQHKPEEVKPETSRKHQTWWPIVSQKLLASGMDYKSIGRLVYNVTGCSTFREAEDAGELNHDGVARILSLANVPKADIEHIVFNELVH